MRRKSQAVIIDRDGTIMDERGYLSDPHRINIYPSAVRGLKMLQKMGYRLVIVTNQSGVARGFLTLTQLKAIHKNLLKKLKTKGIRIDKIYYCPHGPNQGCACRKPKGGMLEQARRDLKIDLKNSWVIGDQIRDIEMGQTKGVPGILVLTGGGRSTPKKKKAAKITSNLETAAQWLINEKI